jgi:hypothetical protein
MPVTLLLVEAPEVLVPVEGANLALIQGHAVAPKRLPQRRAMGRAASRGLEPGLPARLAKVTRVIAFGSHLRTGVDRPSDVDIARGLAPKERRPKVLRELNYRRVGTVRREGPSLQRNSGPGTVRLISL